MVIIKQRSPSVHNQPDCKIFLQGELRQIPTSVSTFSTANIKLKFVCIFIYIFYFCTYCYEVSHFIMISCDQIGASVWNITCSTISQLQLTRTYKSASNSEHSSTFYVWTFFFCCTMTSGTITSFSFVWEWLGQRKGVTFLVLCSFYVSSFCLTWSFIDVCVKFVVQQ